MCIVWAHSAVLWKKRRKKCSWYLTDSVFSLYQLSSFRIFGPLCCCSRDRLVEFFYFIFLGSPEKEKKLEIFTERKKDNKEKRKKVTNSMKKGFLAVWKKKEKNTVKYWGKDCELTKKENQWKVVKSRNAKRLKSSKSPQKRAQKRDKSANYSKCILIIIFTQHSLSISKRYDNRQFHILTMRYSYDVVLKIWKFLHPYRPRLISLSLSFEKWELCCCTSIFYYFFRFYLRSRYGFIALAGAF